MVDQIIGGPQTVEFSSLGSRPNGWQTDGTGPGHFYGPDVEHIEAIAASSAPVMMHNRSLTAGANDAVEALAALCAALDGDLWKLEEAPAWALARVVFDV